MQDVAGCPCGEPAVPELLAEVGYVDLDALGGRGRRCIPPELVDQSLCRDDLVSLQQEDRKHGALLDATERQQLVVLCHLERAKKPEVHLGSAAESLRPYHPTLRVPSRTRRRPFRGAAHRPVSARYPLSGRDGRTA